MSFVLLNGLATRPLLFLCYWVSSLYFIFFLFHLFAFLLFISETTFVYCLCCDFLSSGGGKLITPPPWASFFFLLQTSWTCIVTYDFRRNVGWDPSYMTAIFFIYIFQCPFSMIIILHPVTLFKALNSTFVRSGFYVLVVLFSENCCEPFKCCLRMSFRLLIFREYYIFVC